MENLPFPRSEYERRIDRFQESMQRRQLDALVFTTPANFRYATGLNSQFWESPTRPWFLVIPRTGSSIAVVPALAEVPMKQCVFGSIESWMSPCPEDEGVSLLTSVLQRLPNRFGKIGFELGRESTLRMPILDFFRIRDNLTSFQIVDGSPCIWEVRNVKSKLEIEKIRSICQLVSQSFEAVPSFARQGMTEAEVGQRFTIDILDRGAHTIPYLACASGPGGYDQVITRGKNRTLSEGDVLIMDVGATIDGYHCDFDRNYAIGNISDAADNANEAVWNATNAGINAARPGAKVSDVWRAMMRVLEDEGMQSNNAGRMGHGLGLQLTEPPSNCADDEAVLQPGMVITIEPGMEYQEGKMIFHEENIAITEDGMPDLLTVRAPREMWRVR
ncbi:M24 family metallopeptidase [Paraburkholderia sp. MM6662-R1]|uniref:M24 family metallopeptidase n=1 Tax=Paraburkholderia sp. MM6662-R1 TaxID=2991066 RepID=UPI003D2505E0